MSFERQIFAQTQDLQNFKTFNMSQMIPKEVFNNTAYSVQLPYIAGHSFKLHAVYLKDLSVKVRIKYLI